MGMMILIVLKLKPLVNFISCGKIWSLVIKQLGKVVGNIISIIIRLLKK